MTARYAVYYAPARDSLLWHRAQHWLVQPDLETLTVSARRYGFHATIRAPMTLSLEPDDLDAALSELMLEHRAVALTGLAPRMLEGFLALTMEPQPKPVTDLAASVVKALEPLRAPLSADERERRLRAPLTPRQIELVDEYGYPYVLDEFLFHMTLTDRLPEDRREEMVGRATEWFADALSEPIRLDRLVVFEEPEPGAAFVRRDPDYVLMGA